MDTRLNRVDLPSAAIATTHRFAELLEAQSRDPEEPETFFIHTKGLTITLWKKRHLDSGRILTRDIARLRYEPLSKCWSLWQPLSADHWEPVDGIDPNQRIEPLLLAIYDNTGIIFW